MYSAITNDLGFIRHRHEGKITGLAAYGNADVQRLGLQNLIRYDRNKHRFISREIAAHHKDIQSKSSYFYPLLDKFSREDLSAVVQKIFEQVICEFIKDAADVASKKGFSSRNICLAGGCFANVRLNQKVLDLDLFDNIFIFPAMGDGGLSAGAALYFYHSLSENDDKSVSELDHTYLGGKPFPDAEIESVLKKHQLAYTKYDTIEEEIGKLLAKGKVVARFNGCNGIWAKSFGKQVYSRCPIRCIHK